MADLPKRPAKMISPEAVQGTSGAQAVPGDRTTPAGTPSGQAGARPRGGLRPDQHEAEVLEVNGKN